MKVGRAGEAWMWMRMSVGFLPHLPQLAMKYSKKQPLGCR